MLLCKRIGLAFLGSLLLYISASAQAYHYKIPYVDDEDEVVERDNFFIGFGIKGNVFVNDNAAHEAAVWSKPSFGADVFVGKWFSYYFGSRLTFEMGKLHPFFQHRTIMVDENYVMAKLDLLFNLSNCFREEWWRSKPGYNLIPYIGVSGIQVFNVKNRPDQVTRSSSFLYGGGLYNTFRLSNSASLFLNIGMDIVEADLDGSKSVRKINGIASTGVGVVFNL